MRFMLDFYFDAIEASRECDSRMLSDANIWLQTIFTKGCAFLSLLDGINYEKPGVRLNTVLDPSLLFTIARRIYESVVDFNILIYSIPLWLRFIITHLINLRAI